MLHFENCNVFKQFFARGNKVKFNQFSLFVEILFADETLKKTLNDKIKESLNQSLRLSKESIIMLRLLCLLNTLCSRYYASYQLLSTYILYQILYFIFIIK